MRRSASLALMLATASVTMAGGPQIGSASPKLVVVISIDQFRGDYVDRFAPYYLPAKSGGKLGGFRYLAEQGAWFRDAHHNHIPTATGPGHATLLTGSEPAVNGIVGNGWYDRARSRNHYVVDDLDVESVGGQGGKMSPKPLLTTTVGDEMKLATNGKSKVVGIAIKDRASILMAGHAADTVIWFDSTTGNWVTSTWYAPNGKLPQWVDELNSSRLVDKAFGKNWEPLLPASAYALARKSPAEKSGPGGKVFSYPLGTPGGKPDRAYWNAIANADYGNEFVFETAKRAVQAESLGVDDVTDILCVNLSTNDYVGHRFGPNAPEVLDISVRTDRLLSDFLNHLNAKVGMKNVTVVVTADHGVLPIVEEASALKIPSQRISPASISKAINEALTASFGAGNWVLGSGLYEQNFYLNRETAAEKKVAMADVERVAAEAAMKQPGIAAAFTRTQIMNGQLPRWTWVDRVNNGYHPIQGGDLMIIEAPGVYPSGGTGTGHGSAWEYDSHVPILMAGRGIQAGKYSRRVATADIASTLCHLIGVEYPTGNVGHPLREAIDPRK